MTKEEYTKNKMQEMARAITDILPKGYGFFLQVFPFGDDDGRANYISNAERSDVLNVMKEFIIKCGAEEDWMKHIN